MENKPLSDNQRLSDQETPRVPRYVVLGYLEHEYGTVSPLEYVHRHETIEDAQLEQYFLVKRYPSDHFAIFEQTEKDGTTTYTELNTPPPFPTLLFRDDE